jgi:starch synthase
VCAEVFPLLKTGGLADVCAALPDALRDEGADVRLLLPAFPSISAGVAPEGDPIPLPLGRSTWPHIGPQTALPPAFVQHQLPTLNADLIAHAQPWLQRGRMRHNDQTVYVLHAPALFGREGHPYVNEHGHAWADAPLQFAWLGWAGALLALGHDADWCPEVVHGHDWHSGLTAAYLHVLHKSMPHQARPNTVFTIHNLAYQGVCSPQWRGPLGIPDELFHMNGLEFHGQLSFIKGGLCYSDHLTTVSPRYAQEITQPEQGCGLDGVLRHRQHRLQGILNGVDERIWHPAHDIHVQPGYDSDHLQGKALAKARLQTELGLAVRPNAMLCVVVSRLTEQKGLHLLPEIASELVQRGGQLAVLGSGDSAIESALAACVQQYPTHVALRLGYDEALAHRIIAGGDVILVPSRFEPCGLTQLYGLRYGTLPLVRAVGGLADTVTDCTLEHLASGTATGFVFQELHVPHLLAALRRAFALWQRPADWQAVQTQAMHRRHDWSQAAQAYLHIYRHAEITDMD